MLADAGYQTWLVGKWHLGDINSQYLPLKRGFQYHYGFLGGEVDYWKHASGNRPDWYRNGEAVQEEGYTTELLADDAIRMIRGRDKSRPFFLDLSLNAPHTPLESREPYLSHFATVSDERRRTYLAMVEDMDAAIGRVYAALEEEGIADHTLLVWMSDNGGQTTGGGGSNTPLRGMKGEAFDGGMRVPAFALWPKGLEGGWTFDKFMTVLDWAPTLAAITGARLDPAVELDGIDMWPSLRNGEPAARSHAILGGGANYSVFRNGWKLVEQNAANGQSQRFLFRILDDPSEQRDVAAGNPDVMVDLLAILRSQPVGSADSLK
jgi:arylsulfatase A-like enzyme